MAKARLLFRDKMLLADGYIVEMTIWSLPASNAERPHGLKYSLFYGRPGLRALGYDNESGKGDHSHDDGQEYPYEFTTVEQLVADFLAGVRKKRSSS